MRHEPDSAVGAEPSPAQRRPSFSLLDSERELRPNVAHRVIVGYSLGMTALLVVVGFFSGAIAALPRAGAWMSWIKKAAGVVLLLMAEYYFVKAGQVW